MQKISYKINVKKKSKLFKLINQNFSQQRVLFVRLKKRIVSRFDQKKAYKKAREGRQLRKKYEAWVLEEANSPNIIFAKKNWIKLKITDPRKVVERRMLIVRIKLGKKRYQYFKVKYVVVKKVPYIEPKIPEKYFRINNHKHSAIQELRFHNLSRAIRRGRARARILYKLEAQRSKQKYDQRLHIMERRLKLFIGSLLIFIIALFWFFGYSIWLYFGENTTFNST